MGDYDFPLDVGDLMRKWTNVLGFDLAEVDFL